MYDKNSLKEKINNINREEEALLKELNYFGIDKNMKSKGFDKLLDLKCTKKELLDKLSFVEKLERCMKK